MTGCMQKRTNQDTNQPCNQRVPHAVVTLDHREQLETVAQQTATQDIFLIIKLLYKEI